METYTAWEWMGRRVIHNLGDLANDFSFIIPAPVWFETGEKPGVGIRWYGVVVTYPDRPKPSQLEGVTPSLGRLLDAVDDLTATRTLTDFRNNTTRVWNEAVKLFGRSAVVTVLPPFFGQDP